MVSNVFWKQWLGYSLVILVIVLPFNLYFSNNFNDWLYSLVFIPLTYFAVSRTFRYSRNCDSKRFTGRIFIYAFIVRVVAVFIFYEILTYYNLVPFISYADDWNYNESAKEIAYRWMRDGNFSFYSDIYLGTGSYSGYPNLSALFMYFFGENPLVPRICQSLFSALTCVLMYKICQKYTSEDKSRLVAIISVFSPLLYTFSALQLKDTILLFLCILTLYAIIKLFISRNKFKGIIMACIGLTGMMFFRPASIIPFIACIVFIPMYRKSNKMSSIFGALVIIGIFLFIWNYLAGTSMFSEESNYFSNRYMHMMTSDYTESNARLTATSLAQYVGAPLYLSLGLFLPAPLLANLVHADSINYTAFSLLENITLYPFMLVGFFIILKNFKQKDYFIPVLIAFIFIMFKIGQANSLQTILSARQSLATITMMYFFIPLCPLNYNKKKTKRWILIIALTISIVYTLVRLYSHGQL